MVASEDSPATPSGSTLHPYVADAFAADPILASDLGETSRLGELGSVEPDALADWAGRRRRWLAETERSAAPPAGGTEWLERELLLTELRGAVAVEEHQRPWQRAAYWYPERIGDALSVLIRQADGPDAPAVPLAEHLVSRLRGIPGYLADATANLGDDVPELWATMGVEAADGLGRFLADVVDGFAGTVPAALGADLRSAAAAAGPAVDDYAGAVRELAGRATGSWVAGREHVDLLLRDVQHLDIDAEGLADLGRAGVEQADADLVAFAAGLDPDTPWQQQISAVKDDHPEPEAFLQTYRAAMLASADHVRRADLVGVPAGEACEMRWVPDYQRSTLPLGAMNPVPPFADGLDSEFLITPADPTADAGRRREHQRDNCFAFATSIAGHETYPGHHLQAVHHKLGTPRSSMRRYFRSPQFVEGWGLYVEDLLAETGFMNDQVLLFKHRNALWRALRVVIDTGLHTGTLSFPAAVGLLQERAGMDRHMAVGEVRRYTRHDNPTYPSSYFLGRRLWHDLRRTWQSGQPPTAGLRDFHDQVLGFGSPPVPLLAAALRPIA